MRCGYRGSCETPGPTASDYFDTVYVVPLRGPAAQRAAAADTGGRVGELLAGSGVVAASVGSLRAGHGVVDGLVPGWSQN